MHQTGARDPSLVQGECFEFGQTREVLETLVGNSRAVEGKALEPREFCEGRQVVVR